MRFYLFPMLVFGAFLLVKAPELLEKRLHTRESQSEQKLVILLSALLFVAVFVIAGLDYRRRKSSRRRASRLYGV